MPEFRTSEERRAWFIKNADYFTIICRFDGHNHRLEVPTLEQAEQVANRIVDMDPAKRLLIYAVCGPSDNWVKNVMRTKGVPTK